MNILGLNFIGYDSSSCLLQEGRLVAAYEEERLNRRKYTLDFPRLGIERCLARGSISIDEVDCITLNWNPWVGMLPRAWNALRYSPLSLIGAGVPNGRASLASWLAIVRLAMTFEKQLGIPSSKVASKIRRITHHVAHNASSYYVSGFERAALLSLDASGEWTTTVLGLGEGTRMESLRHVDFPHSLGFFYQAVTELLGFGTIAGTEGGEGKVMGLAAYGDPSRFEKEFGKLYRLTTDGFRLDLDYFRFQRPDATTTYSPKLLEILGPKRESGDELSQRHYDLAAGLQRATEEIGLHLARRLYELTKSRKLCISGGVGLNCVLNGRILRELPYDEIFVQPAVNDAGGSVGGAFFAWHQIFGNPLSFVWPHSYWGDDFSDNEMREALESRGLSYTYLAQPPEKAAELISNGRIIGWFQGRMEFGPRALGNRSILADPREPQMQLKINLAVKHRETFRPFAPAVLRSAASTVFDMGQSQESAYMLMTFPVRAAWKERIPTVTHEDGSARVQTVTEESNPRFWALLKHFERLTGVPMVVNTSFNDRDEPIVASPDDAVRCFLNTEIDDLVLGNFHVTRESLRE